ncbi:MAG: hypothetical protein B6242_11080 [Anaerolineaceae bacterium 4572_78]|nr:MAG: hypothetical protein B6242_11080 [Anaerolineaceae bacterium 4572_78]
MPSLVHSYIQAKLINILFDFKDYNIHSELTLTINGKDYTPDVVIYPKNDISINFAKDVIKMTDMPKLAIEVLSPTQGVQEILDKFEVYFESGIKSCWLVQPFPSIITVCQSLTEKQVFSTGDLMDKVLNIKFQMKKVFE